MKRLAVGPKRRIPSSSITTNSTKAVILRRGSSRISWFKRCELRSNRSASKQHNRRAPPTGECLIRSVNQKEEKKMATLPQAVHSNKPTNEASAAKVDMKLEVVVIAVSDVDRAKDFYG